MGHLTGTDLNIPPWQDQPRTMFTFINLHLKTPPLTPFKKEKKKSYFPMAMSSLLSKRLIFHWLTPLIASWNTNQISCWSFATDRQRDNKEPRKICDKKMSVKQPTTTGRLPNLLTPYLNSPSWAGFFQFICPAGLVKMKPPHNELCSIWTKGRQLSAQTLMNWFGNTVLIIQQI